MSYLTFVVFNVCCIIKMNIIALCIIKHNIELYSIDDEITKNTISELCTTSNIGYTKIFCDNYYYYIHKDKIISVIITQNNCNIVNLKKCFQEIENNNHLKKIFDKYDSPKTPLLDESINHIRNSDYIKKRLFQNELKTKIIMLFTLLFVISVVIIIVLLVK